MGANLLNSGTRGLDQIGNVINDTRTESTNKTPGVIQPGQLGQSFSDTLSDGLDPFSGINSDKGAQNFLSNFFVGFSSQQSRQEWTESVSSGIYAGNNITINAGGDIALAGAHKSKRAATRQLPR